MASFIVSSFSISFSTGVQVSKMLRTVLTSQVSFRDCFCRLGFFSKAPKRLTRSVLPKVTLLYYIDNR